MGACVSRFSVTNSGADAPVDAPESGDFKSVEETVKRDPEPAVEEADRQSLLHLLKENAREVSVEKSNEVALAKQQENETENNPDPVVAAAALTEDDGTEKSTVPIEKTEEKLAETTKLDDTIEKSDDSHTVKEEEEKADEDKNGTVEEKLAETANPQVPIEVEDELGMQTINQRDDSPTVEDQKPDLDELKEKKEMQPVESTNAVVTEKIEEQKPALIEETEKLVETPELETTVTKESEKNDAEKQKTEERLVETTKTEETEVATEKSMESTPNVKSENPKTEQHIPASDAEKKTEIEQ